MKQELENPLSPVSRKEFVKALLRRWIVESETTGVLTARHPMEMLHQMKQAEIGETSFAGSRSKPPGRIIEFSRDTKELMIHLALVNRVDPAYYNALASWARWRAADGDAPWDALRVSRTIFDKRFEGGVAILMSKYY